MQINFIKMDGLGNDFVIIDARKDNITLNHDQALKLADRNNKETGGCDQLIIIRNSGKADCFMQIINADGSEVDACGNASRCIGWLVGREKARNNITIETKAGLLDAKIVGEHKIAVDMGPARLEWYQIPLAEKMDTLHMKIEEGELKDPVGVSMGNPHAVFFVDDVEQLDLRKTGPRLEHHRLFPQRANIGFAQIISPSEIKLRVFERGAGETLACGTGACAALVAAARRGLTGRKAIMHLKGGNLEIEWLSNGHVLMTGEVSEAMPGNCSI